MQFILIVLDHKPMINIKIFFWSLFSFVLITSCNMYKANEIIEKGEQTIRKHQHNIEELINISNDLVNKQCRMYMITTSATTDIFLFSEHYYDNENQRIKETGSFIDISESNKNKIWDYRPKSDITEFTFVKNAYIFFKLNKYRSYSNNRAKLIYCYNKDIFMSLFSNYAFFEKGQQNEINDSLKWVYFYDEHWAITTSSPFFQKTIEECNEIIEY